MVPQNVEQRQHRTRMFKSMRAVTPEALWRSMGRDSVCKSKSTFCLTLLILKMYKQCEAERARHGVFKQADSCKILTWYLHFLINFKSHESSQPGRGWSKATAQPDHDTFTPDGIQELMIDFRHLNLCPQPQRKCYSAFKNWLHFFCCSSFIGCSIKYRWLILIILLFTSWFRVLIKLKEKCSFSALFDFTMETSLFFWGECL